MIIQNNISLKPYNTFGIDVLAKRFVSITSMYDLQQLLKTEKDFFLISGGSNMLLTNDIDKLVVHIDIKGISIDAETSTSINITANAGENWHEFVRWCVSQEYGGLENLSLIPGNVGTCPIQNIGAYGVEVKDCISKVVALEISTGKLRTFSNRECVFGYRDSYFKNAGKNNYVLCAVSFVLTKNTHTFATSYGAITAALEEKGVHKPTLQHISDAVIAIRSSKLPDPAKLGNSGSFFKNPVIATTLFKKLQEKYPKLPQYPVSETETKVPAGWLIEQCGFKGKRVGDAGVHSQQALVLVNHNKATGKEILALARTIQQTVEDTFGIALEIEVNIIA